MSFYGTVGKPGPRGLPADFIPVTFVAEEFSEEAAIEEIKKQNNDAPLASHQVAIVDWQNQEYFDQVTQTEEIRQDKFSLNAYQLESPMTVFLDYAGASNFQIYQCNKNVISADWEKGNPWGTILDGSYRFNIDGSITFNNFIISEGKSWGFAYKIPENIKDLLFNEDNIFYLIGNFVGEGNNGNIRLFFNLKNNEYNNSKFFNSGDISLSTTPSNWTYQEEYEGVLKGVTYNFYSLFVQASAPAESDLKLNGTFYPMLILQTQENEIVDQTYVRGASNLISFKGNGETTSLTSTYGFDNHFFVGWRDNSSSPLVPVDDEISGYSIFLTYCPNNGIPYARETYFVKRDSTVEQEVYSFIPTGKQVLTLPNLYIENIFRNNGKENDLSIKIHAPVEFMSDVKLPNGEILTADFYLSKIEERLNLIESRLAKVENKTSTLTSTPSESGDII